MLAQCCEISLPDGNLVEWKYVNYVFDLQSYEGIRAANKLSRYHLQFDQHKMNVRLAAQTMSKSIADAIFFVVKI